MSRHSLSAKVAEAAAAQDALRREQNCAGPQAAVNDKKLVEECFAQGEAKKAKVDVYIPPPRAENSLFYRLYPQTTKDDATQKARKYWGTEGEAEEAPEREPLPSDTVMSGALSALAFVNGGATGSATNQAPGAGAPVGAPAGAAAGTTARAGSEDPEALKRKLLEALGGESAGATVEPAAAALSEGTLVELFGLKGAPELNGRRGTLQSFDVSAGRWQVDVEDAGLKKLKPENLKPASPAQGVSTAASEDACKRQRTESEMVFV